MGASAFDDVLHVKVVRWRIARTVWRTWLSLTHRSGSAVGYGASACHRPLSLGGRCKPSLPRMEVSRNGCRSKRSRREVWKRTVVAQSPPPPPCRVSRKVGRKANAHISQRCHPDHGAPAALDRFHGAWLVAIVRQMHSASGRLPMRHDNLGPSRPAPPPSSPAWAVRVSHRRVGPSRADQIVAGARTHLELPRGVYWNRFTQLAWGTQSHDATHELIVHEA